LVSTGPAPRLPVGAPPSVVLGNSTGPGPRNLLPTAYTCSARPAKCGTSLLALSPGASPEPVIHCRWCVLLGDYFMLKDRVVQETGGNIYKRSLSDSRFLSVWNISSEVKNQKIGSGSLWWTELGWGWPVVGRAGLLCPSFWPCSLPVLTACDHSRSSGDRLALPSVLAGLTQIVRVSLELPRAGALPYQAWIHGLLPFRDPPWDCCGRK
jgi:hypothetical protein